METNTLLKNEIIYWTKTLTLSISHCNWSNGKPNYNNPEPNRHLTTDSFARSIITKARSPFQLFSAIKSSLPPHWRTPLECLSTRRGHLPKLLLLLLPTHRSFWSWREVQRAFDLRAASSTPSACLGSSLKYDSPETWSQAYARAPQNLRFQTWSSLRSCSWGWSCAALCVFVP